MNTALAVEPPSRHFKMSDEKDFVAELTALDRRTLIQPLGSARDILLDGQARTLAAGHRLTSLALYQVCQGACPGLYRFLQELSGTNRMPEQAKDDYSLEEALDTYNRVVRRRFATRLGGRQLVRDSRDGLVVGVVGSRYRRLANLALYEKTRELLRKLERPPDFYEASLRGWWVMFRYYVPKSYCLIEGPLGERDRYLAGYHFSNNEVGEASARAAAFLLRDYGRTSALCLSAAAGRVRHRGHTFERRLQSALEAALERLRPPDFYAGRLLALRATEALAAGKEAAARERAREELRHRLRRRLTDGAARAVIEDVVARGSYEDRPSPPGLAEGPLAPARSAYDVFNSLGRVARGLAISARERLEQVAYSLLAGQFSVL
jgi:hypothetical protein